MSMHAIKTFFDLLEAIKAKATTLFSILFVASLSQFPCMVSADSEDLVWNMQYSNKVDNVGFMKNPSKELTERFSMCDAFLDIDWIDKEKKIGYSQYDIYIDGNKNGQMAALVYLNKHYPHFDYDVYTYKRSGGLKELFEFIKEGGVIGRDQLLEIKKEDKKVTFWPTLPIVPVVATLSDNRLNVCIPYPDNELVWIVEGVKANKIYSDDELIGFADMLSASISNIGMSELRGMSVLDINVDGDVDFYKGRHFILSHDGSYYEMKKTKSSYQYAEWVFPPNQKKCELKPRHMYYLTTDGASYFLSNQCNLTALSQGDE